MVNNRWQYFVFRDCFCVLCVRTLVMDLPINSSSCLLAGSKGLSTVKNLVL